jgi:hypothetical protein
MVKAEPLPLLPLLLLLLLPVPHPLLEVCTWVRCW